MFVFWWVTVNKSFFITKNPHPANPEGMTQHFTPVLKYSSTYLIEHKCKHMYVYMYKREGKKHKMLGMNGFERMRRSDLLIISCQSGERERGLNGSVSL